MHFEPRGHQVVVAAPADCSEALSNAGIAHAPFDHPGDETLGPIWARLGPASQDEANAIAVREIFAGANARAAMPKLLESIRSFGPSLIVRDSANSVR